MTTKKMKKPKSSDFKEFLLQRLEDPLTAAAYLTASFEEGDETFLLAVKDVAEAAGGIAPLAKATKLNREGLYDMLSKKGNPRLSSLSAIIDVLGLKLEFTPKPHPAKAA